MTSFDIKDNKILHRFQYTPISAMEWVFLTEKLISTLAYADDELASLLRSVTGLETNELLKSNNDFVTKIATGCLKALSFLKDSEKTEIYNKIFKGYSLHTAEGGVLFLNCDLINTLIKQPHNFYLIVFQCLKGHYSDFFLEATEMMKSVESQGTQQDT